MFKNLSIRTKLIGSFLIIILCMASVGYFFIINLSQEALEKSIGKDSIILAQILMDKINRNINNRIEQSEIYAKDLSEEMILINSNKEFDKIASSSDINELISKRDEEWVSASEETLFMKSIIKNDLSNEIRQEFKSKDFYQDKYGYSVFAEVFITNKYGVNVAQTQRTTDYYQADENWWQMAREDGLFVSKIEYDKSASVYSIDICIRMNNEDGKFLGIMKTVLNIQEIFNIIEELSPNGRAGKYTFYGHEGHDTGKFKLVSNDGKLIFSTEEAGFEIFEDISPNLLMHFQNSNASYFVTSKDEEREKLFAYAVSEGYKDFNGLGWIFVVEHETKEIFASVNALRDRLIIIITIALILFLLSSLVISYSITSSIKKLSRTVAAISKGDLRQRAEIKSKDEIGQLANNFNKMTNELQKSRSEIEKKVAERTVDLEKINSLMVDRELKMIELKKEIEELKKNV